MLFTFDVSKCGVITFSYKERLKRFNASSCCVRHIPTLYSMLKSCVLRKISRRLPVVKAVFIFVKKRFKAGFNSHKNLQ